MYQPVPSTSAACEMVMEQDGMPAAVSGRRRALSVSKRRALPSPEDLQELDEVSGTQAATMDTEPAAGVARTANARRQHTRSTRSSRGFISKTVAAVAVASALIATASAAVGEPPGNQILFGAWIDTQAGFEDTPTKFNARMGYNVPVYQIAQVIPLPRYNYTTGAGGPAPESLIERSGTDAAVFLTVYPQNGFGSYVEADLIQLANQIRDYEINLNRTTYLRWAPEMQGTWNEYGFQPVAYVEAWRQMAAVIKAIAPLTILVWAPNTPQSYPYGQSTSGLSAAEIAALDTDQSGTIDINDDAFAPYYPGDDVVDWIGLSVYYKGPSTSDNQNVVQTNGYCAAVMNGTNPTYNTPMSNWYQTYCAEKPDKACMFAESGAAYHVNITSGASQAAIQNAWFLDCITNATMLDQFPRLKMIMAFEYAKMEYDSNIADYRDYRITNDTGVLNEFLADIALMPDRFSWANIRNVPTSISSAGAPAATNSLGETTQNAITATLRERPTGFPSLFGTTSAASQLTELLELGILISAGVLGAVFTLKAI